MSVFLLSISRLSPLLSSRLSHLWRVNNHIRFSDSVVGGCLSADDIFGVPEKLRSYFMGRGGSAATLTNVVSSLSQATYDEVAIKIRVDE